MKNEFKKVLSLALALLMCGSIVACNPETGNTGLGGEDYLEEEVDPNRYQLEVSVYNGGYGTAWLGELKKRYEAAHKNDVYDGKTGVQVMIYPNKTKASGLVDNGLSEDVYFTEYAYYYDLLAKGALGDISDAVAGAPADLSVYNEGDAAGTTIKDKLTAQQEQYYNVNGKYYGVPHYAGYSGIVYNKRLFEKNNWYFAKTQGTTLQSRFITATNTQKSNGPDGLPNTYDDGLPATYEEFFWLCDWIDLANKTAVTVNGESVESYVNGLNSALAVDNNGLEQSLLNYTFNGTATNLVTMDENGNITQDAAATPITQANGYELTRQAGKAYSLQFTKQLLTTDEGAYMHDKFDEPSFFHKTAQEEFVFSEIEGEKAMLIEGIWWEAEATKAFSDAAAELGEQYSKQNSDFAWLPMPKATAEQAGGVTLYDNINSMIFMNKACEADQTKKALALDFIRYANTNKALVEFTQITGAPKAMTYSLTSTEKEVLTPFAKSVLNMKELPTTQIVYPYATSKFFQTNQRMICEIFYSLVDGKTHVQPVSMFISVDNPKSATDVFEGMNAYRTGVWEEWLANVVE